MDKFKKFWAYKVLPLVYDSSLSYLEVLQKLVTKINEVIATTGELAANVVEALKNSESALNTANEAENTAQTALDSVPTKTSEITNDSGFVNASQAANAAPVQSVNGNTGHVNTFNFGVCNASVSTAAKTVNIPNVTELINGLSILVLFTNGNSISNITLKVNNFDAYPVYAFGNTLPPSNSLSSGEIVELIYNNSAWFFNRGGVASTSVYGVTRLSNSTSSNSTTLAATPSAVKEVKDAIPTKVSELDNDSNFIPKSNVLAWSNITNTDTLAQAQAKLITEPGYFRTWAYGSGAAYCPSSNTCVFTAYCKDSNIDYLYFSAVDTITGEMYIADKTGVWHKQINYDDYLITRDYVDQNIAVAGNSYVEHYIDSIGVSGYTPIGVVGTRIGGSIRCCLYYTNLSTPVSGKYTRVLIGVRNIMGDAQTISCGCTVLYRKDA